MDLPDYLTQEGTGEIRVTGHRIGLFHLVHHYNDGYSAEMLVCQFPSLPLAVVHKVIAFYLENRTDVDTYVAACQSELSRQHAVNPSRIDVVALRQRLERLAQAESP